MTMLSHGASRHGADSAWLPRRALRAGAALRLFCFPYAGGSVATYQGWAELLPDNVDVCPIQLPGRGPRLREPLPKRLGPLVRDLVDALRPHLDRPFALFGHSMGGLIAFELARALRAALGLEPEVFFASAWRPPDVPDTRRDYALPDEAFVTRLRELNGTPSELLDDPEALSLLMPIVRADFELVQTYAWSDAPPLGCRIKAIGGVKDVGTPPAVLRGWSRHTSGPFSLSLLPGGHFFIEESRAQLLTVVAHELGRALERAPRTS